MIRQATADDLPLLKELWQEFHREVPEPEYVHLDLDEELREIDKLVGAGGALLAEDDGEPLGYALAELRHGNLGFLSDLYVRPQARRRGVAKELVRETVTRLLDRGATHMQLEVLASNVPARTVYERWGFRTEELTLVSELAALRRRLGDVPASPSFGSIHIQTDDRSAVEREVAKYLPRFGRSGGTEISEPRNGWTAVYDELSDRDPEVLRKLARELSYATAAVTLTMGVERGEVVRYVLFERGGVVDEYLSVPEYYGPLPPGDVIALGSNPTVVSRLTGADPGQIRAAARTGSNPAELPPPAELLREIAAAMGITGAEHGHSGR
ncbi:MAG TPA: GNAT family N-acetyltransferase [Gaiellaceae bacterium]